MGWWETVGGAVIGDPAANYVEALMEAGVRCTELSDLPPAAREELKELYLEGIGRAPTDEEIRALLAFCA